MVLTEKQRRILVTINESITRLGYPPTIREIGKAVGISSTSVVNYHLNKLKDQGLLERDDQISRGLKVMGRAAQVLSGNLRIPILGTIQAGEPIPVLESRTPAETDELDMVELTADMAQSHKALFALRVKGDSMIDALINEGDLVVLEPIETARNGDMVAAWIKDREETTLKHFYQESDRVRLQPANPTMQPIYVPAEQVRVQGRVVAVIRNLN
ncbi:MAG: transcriptional repressor LexA [Anaerolineae bacterium]|jgi:repressor LexA|nr:transcriptional repressor LexA [Ardenticatenia bacterium]MBK8539294.1 transcriptional repressor LexA [Ardenticatenia bacterium]HQZ71285.1 transcriptional repressor LexA [Anaerolineae bacterium]HRA19305.1 transcriptional repressor LexA [Anaerolineae bacterium]